MISRFQAKDGSGIRQRGSRLKLAVVTLAALAASVGLYGGVHALSLRSLGAMRPEAQAEDHNFHWREIGPGGFGWMHAVAFNPHDAQTLIAGLDMGSAFRSTDGGHSWTHIGRVGVQPFAQPAYGGMLCTAYDPERPDRVWIGSKRGASESTDGGQTWALRLGGSAAYPIAAIAIDPSNDRVVYAASGDSADSGQRFIKGDIWKTTDGGVSWNKIGRPGGSANQDIAKARNWSRIVIDAASNVISGQGHARVYVVGPGGLFVSEDAGASWTSLESDLPGGRVNLRAGTDADSFPLSSASDIALTPGHGRQGASRVLATLRARYTDSSRSTVAGGVCYSDDEGKSWTMANGGLSTALKQVANRVDRSFLLISVCASKPQTVYLSDWNDIFVSHDGGLNWTRTTNTGYDYEKVTDFDGKQITMALPRGGGNFVKGKLDGVIGLEVAPSNPEMVAYTSSDGVGLSTDGGREWDEALYDLGKPFHPHAFGDRPPFRATNLQHSRGAQIIVANGLAVDPFDSRMIAIAYDDNGLNITRDSGEWWEWATEGILSGERNNVQSVIFDPRARGRLFMGSKTRWGGPAENLYRSDDNGRTFHRIQIPLLVDAVNNEKKDTVINALALDTHAPADRVILYAATNLGVYKTTDGGSTWQDVSGPLAGKPVFKLVMDPSRPERLYAGLRDVHDGSIGGLYRTEDGGRSWNQVAPDRLGDIQSLSICQSDPKVLVVVAGSPHEGGDAYWKMRTTWRTTDGGGSWRQIDARRAACAAVNPESPNIVYVCTWAGDVNKEPVGFWVSHDGGSTWHGANEGLSLALANPNNQIAFDPKDAHHLFLIHSSGVFEGRD